LLAAASTAQELKEKASLMHLDRFIGVVGAVEIFGLAVVWQY
jgi:hypothetical protein